MSRGELSVEVVEGKGPHEAFVRLPWRIYRNDPNWVAPFLREERRRWNEDQNPSLRGRWHRRFLALREGRVVGRIAAIVDREFQARWEPRAGFFGFLECEDDAEAARALLDAAGGVLHERGADLALGPISLTMHDECGALVSGFETPPMVLAPYNPRYLPGLLEEAGCIPRMELTSYLWTPESPVSPAAERFLDGALSRGTDSAGSAGVRLRPVDLACFEEECRLLLELYNDSFRHLWGFVPMTWDEFHLRAKAFRPFLRAELILILEVAGAPQGFCLALPDINEALRPLRGRLWPFGWLRLMRSVRRLDSIRLILLGLRPSFPVRSHAVRLAAAVYAAARRIGLRRAELSVVQSGNARMHHLISAFGGRLHKTYRLYQRSCLV